MLKRAALLLILCFPVLSQNPNTAVFPSALLTDQISTVAKDRSVSVLDASIDADDLTLTVDAGHGSRFTQFEILTIEAEQMMVCSVAGDVITICPGTRGFSWTTAVSHSNGADVSGNYVEWIVNQANSELKAIEELLGINGTGVLRTNTDSTTAAETTISFTPGVTKPGFRVGCGPLPASPGSGGVLHCNSASANDPYWHDGAIWRNLATSFTGIANRGFERTGTNFSINSTVHGYDHGNLIVSIYDYDTSDEIKVSTHVSRVAPYAVSLVSNLASSRHMWITVAGWGGPSGTASVHTLLSGTHSDTSAASPVLGDILFANSTPAWTKLAGNTTATRKYLSQLGTGSVSSAPTWEEISGTGDVTGAAGLTTNNSLVKVGATDGGLIEAAASDVVAEFNGGTCTGYLKSDGTCDTPTGGAGDVTGASGLTTNNSLVKVGTTDGGLIEAGFADVVSEFASGACSGYLHSSGSCSTPGGGGGGDTFSPATNTADFLPQWDGANSKTLKNGLAAASGNTISALVQRDGSGNFAANNITAALIGNASTATALAANPADCTTNQFATSINASGTLGCAALTDADVPDSVTVSLAATATALAANPADCSANQFANAIAASGALSCAALVAGDIPSTIATDAEVLAGYQPLDAALTNLAAGSDFVRFSGPATSFKLFTLPDAAATILTTNAAVTVAQGGTGLTAGTSGGVPYFSTTTAMTSSALLAANAVVIGGGAGVAPSTIAASTTTTQALFATATAPAFRAIAAADLPAVPHSFTIASPVVTDDINIMKAPAAMTMLTISCIVMGTTSVTGQMQECATDGTSCTDLDSDITCDADGAADDGALTDSAIASGAWLRWKTTSVSGTPTFLTVTFTRR